VRILTVGIALLLIAAALPGAATGLSTPTRDASELSGVVAAQGIGPLRFGATMAEVRRWAGTPEFTSPPQDGYPFPRRRPGTTILGYHCTGFAGHSCHTLFGFAQGRLTTFSTNSSLFRTRSGVRPGMRVAEIDRRDPPLFVDQTCPAWQGKSIPTLMVSAPQGYAYTLYARTTARPAVFAPGC
jgi:hypothetical protein